jgi:ArsR family transcriptional regulator
MEKYASILKALGHTDRLRIIVLLSKGELTVTELVSILELSQPRITQYIKSLEAVDIIERLREGSWVFSRLKRGQKHVDAIISTVLAAIDDDDPLFCADVKRLNAVRELRSRAADAFFAAVANDNGQLGNEYLPQEMIETVLLKSVANKTYERMIDMGTGTGRMLELFSKHIKTGAGVDMNPDMLKVARHKLASDDFSHISVQQGDLLQIPFRDQSADLVTLHQVLHYLDDPREAILEASRLLKKGGDLIIVDFETHNEDRFRDDYAHRRLGFSNEDMQEWASSAALDLSVEERVTNANSPAVIIWKARKAS